MQTVTDAMQTIDSALLTAKRNNTRDMKFNRLRRTMSSPGPIDVFVAIRGIEAKSHWLPAPYRLVPIYSHSSQIAIFSSNVIFHDRPRVEQFMAEAPDCLIVIWLVDNHHIYNQNQVLCELADVVIPAQYASLDYLYSTSAIVTSPSPCPCVQWTPEVAREAFLKYRQRERSNALYGGFRKYFPMPRNSFIQEIIDKVPHNVVRLLSHEDQSEDGSYFKLEPEQQIADWMGYKASIIVCVKNDIPMRLFDALLTGQIPIVPWDMVGLDAIISPEEQTRLPVLRYTSHTADEVAKRRDAAIESFDRGGDDGMLRRHRFVLNQHMTIHRAASMLTLLENMAKLS